ncbi:Hypothetical_protein [Hexamita inflata]|uniref:Hypothetical_protein n=1 Tax=Hexamita inflata TaxID=28002 RepID=A0AA86RP37_9EUKA|nr:Hypothetical protein HINF_LOCUS64703 [Hexamita inflata]
MIIRKQTSNDKHILKHNTYNLQPLQVNLSINLNIQIQTEFVNTKHNISHVIEFLELVLESEVVDSGHDPFQFVFALFFLFFLNVLVFFWFNFVQILEVVNDFPQRFLVLLIRGRCQHIVINVWGAEVLEKGRRWQLGRLRAVENGWLEFEIEIAG